MSQDGDEKNLGQEKSEPDISGEGLEEISGGQGNLRENVHPDARIQHLKSS
ncbi:MAG TPA: hypothetical protein VKR56_05080 [Candidatus Cybelea sp.]|nr:hypothetical protein [Candidatus Cybelea sp.]